MMMEEPANSEFPESSQLQNLQFRRNKPLPLQPPPAYGLLGKILTIIVSRIFGGIHKLSRIRTL